MSDEQKDDKKKTTIQLSVTTWKLLTKLKFEMQHPDLDTVVKEVLRDAGYLG